MKEICKKLYMLIKRYRFKYFKTLLLNFRLLPLKQAVRLPIVVYSPCETLIRRSHMEFAKGVKLTFGMVALGRNDDKFVGSKERVFIMMLDSVVHVSGDFRLSPGCSIRMDHGVLNLGRNVAIGGGGKLLCNNNITIGDYVQFAFDCVCYDTDYHFISVDDKVTNCKDSVIIGDRTWIGNNCTIGKGSVLPSSSILAARSMTNKNYCTMGEGVLLAGLPARCVKTGCYRIHNKEVEARIHSYYLKTKETYHISKDEFEKSQYR